MHTDRVNFLDLEFDRLNFMDVKARLEGVTDRSSFGYIVTPNVDHVVQLWRGHAYRAAWQDADLCVCDSQILRFLARLRGIRLNLVRGSDLCALLFKEIVQPGDTIAVVGGDKSSVAQLQASFPLQRFAHHEAPMGLLSNPDARGSAAAFVDSSAARFTLFAVGSPQQEMIAQEVKARSDAHGFGLCIGAGLDFVTGEQTRAPKLLQSMGLEWAHRLASNPRRLWRRYLVEGLRILPIFLRWRPGDSSRKFGEIVG